MLLTEKTNNKSQTVPEKNSAANEIHIPSVKNVIPRTYNPIAVRHAV